MLVEQGRDPRYTKQDFMDEMLFSILAFLAGITLLQFFTELPDRTWLWFLLPLLCVLFCSRWLRPVAMGVTGLLWAWWHAAHLLAVQLPVELEGRDVLVRGVVEALPERLAGDRLRVRFTLQRYHRQGHWKPMQLPARVSWYRAAPTMRVGERWQLLVRLKRPRGFINPDGFDYQRWLFAQRIRATGYVRESDRNRWLQPARGFSVHGLREYLRQRIQALDLSESSRALLLALGIGDRSAMDRAHWEVLRETGTSHLMAISGLHVGLVSGLVYGLARRIWIWFGPTQRWQATSVAALLSMLAALGYALLAGFQVPAQRALFMVSAWAISLAWLHRPNPWRVWALALAVVLLIDPLSVLSAGFWLSFGAVAWLLFLSSGRGGKRRTLWRVFALQPGLVLALTPILWVWFHQFSFTAPLANLLAIPWVGFLVLPPLLLGLLCLACLPVVGSWLLTVAAMLLQALWWILDQLAGIPGGAGSLPALSPVWVATLTLGLMCLLAPRPLPLRLVGGVLMAVPLAIHPQRPDVGRAWFTLLDVGQGLSAVVQTRTHVLVYDTGPAFLSGFNSGEAVLVPFLHARGYRNIDRLVISHADNDHIGGGRALFKAMDVRAISSGEPAKIAWARSKRCRADEQWHWDGVKFQYLAPLAPVSGNNASCVLRVATKDGRTLVLPGDIEKSVEHKLLAEYGRHLGADILVAPHHGSRTSSTRAFIAAVDPQLVLFAVGYRNRFGFPNTAVLERYRWQGARLLDTASSGAIEVRIGEKGPLAVRRSRPNLRRYWH